MERQYPQTPLNDPFEFDPEYYREHDFQVIVRVLMSHDQLYGNVSDLSKIRKGPSRFYLIEYLPEVFYFSNGEQEKTIDKTVGGILSTGKDEPHNDIFSVGLILVRRAFARAARALELTDGGQGRLFVLQDVKAAFPWISPQIISHRIEKGFLRLQHRSRGRGTPNVFSLEELVHCGVLDEIASLGAFVDLKRVNVTVHRAG